MDVNVRIVEKDDPGSHAGEMLLKARTWTYKDTDREMATQDVIKD